MKRIIFTTLFACLLTSVCAAVFTAGEKVYYNTNECSGWWTSDGAKPTAYFFNSPTDNAWAGVLAVEEGENVYSIVVPGTAGKTWDNIIFVRKNNVAANLTDWDDVWNQTVDIPAALNQCYYFLDAEEGGNKTGYWGEPCNGDSNDELNLEANILVGVKKPAEWTNIYIYYWTNGEAGKFVTPTLYEGVYAFGFDVDEVNIIFTASRPWASSGDDAERLGKQTINIEGLEAHACFEVVAPTYEDGDADWGKRRINSLYGNNCPFETYEPKQPDPLEPPDPPSALGGATYNGVSVWTENNILKISSENPAQVEIFAVTGKKLFADVNKTCSVELKQGIYILKINNRIYKIAL